MNTKLSFLLASLLTLSACSLISAVPGMKAIVGDEGYFRDHQGDYLSAETIPRLEVPNDMDSYMIDDLLVVPEIDSSNNSVAFLQAPRPKPLEGASTDRQVVIQKIADQSWIIVDSDPAQVWPRIREYWLSNNINIAFENPTQGELETGWFIVTGNVLTKEKIKVSVETGFQNDSTEIRLLHLSLSQATPILDQVKWPKVSDDLELEYDMLTNLAGYLADLSDLYRKSTVSFLAGTIPSEGKANIVKTGNGTEVLKLDAGYERSWAAVGRALKRAGIEVVSSNQNLGVYDIEYSIDTNEKEGMGIMGTVFTLNGLLWKPSPKPAERHSLRLQLLNTGSSVEISVESLSAESVHFDDVEGSLLKAILSFIA